MKKHILILLSFFFFGVNYAQTPIHSSEAIHHPIVAKNGMVATQHVEASKVGLEILEQGGNAVDAAVAIGFSLAVVLPRAGNLGGGGFLLFHDQKNKTTTAFNYREKAPKNATRDMYLDKQGEVDKQRFNQSYLSVGVPGTVKGLTEALEKHGTMSLAQVLEPAIRLAKFGFPVTDDLSRVLKAYEKRLKNCEVTESIFYKEDGSFYEVGDTLIQSDLAWSLQQISDQGSNAFYKGELAKRITNGIIKQGGIITLSDLKNYKVDIRDAISGSYRGYEIVSMPPPSSGGVHVIQMLNMLEYFPMKNLGHNTAESIHLLAETMRLAYADRSEHLGDPFYWNIPIEGLTSKEYAFDLTNKISPYKANDSQLIKPGKPSDFESEETTHFSVIDQDGNVVSNTYTLNFSFGTGLMIAGTGILLNNEMGDFSAKPGVPNAFGLIGGEANAVEAGKRPLSSMTPTIVFKDEKPFLVTGSPGGSRIISTVLQLIVNVIDYDLNVAEAAHAPRIHHQWFPDILYYEKSLNRDTRNLLGLKGHILKARNAMGSTQSIMLKDGLLYGASDPRRPDALTLGF